MKTEDIIVRPASPYQGTEELKNAARELMEEEVDIIFMDCMGYTKEMKEVVKKITGKPVILPRTLITGIINEL
jgi:protein AroM